MTENTKTPVNSEGFDIDQQRTWLMNHGFVIGARDRRRNTDYEGDFMVAHPIEDESLLPTTDARDGGFCVVGEDLDQMVREAFDTNYYADPNVPIETWGPRRFTMEDKSMEEPGYVASDKILPSDMPQYPAKRERLLMMDCLEVTDWSDEELNKLADLKVGESINMGGIWTTRTA